jgi:peptide deformylase
MTFASADYDERRPRGNPTTAYSPDWSKYEARILATGHPLLREIASPVTTFGTAELQTLIDDMFETMRSSQGIGLAAPQIGVSERIIVFEFAGGSRAPGAPPVPATVLINPVITHSEGSACDWERCFSVPGYRGQVMRYTFIHYVARDFHGHRLEGVAEGFHARIVQHEIDHLNGILYTDFADSIELYERPSQIADSRPTATSDSSNNGFGNFTPPAARLVLE